MVAMFQGKSISGPRGFTGPDGNPIGTVITYMGTTSPKDYLICDGSTYNISDYSKLAEFFKTQFGAENYFGGDGTTTFAVPDMRNLFLRGFRGTSEEQLSGDIGVKQEGTKIPYFYTAFYGSEIFCGYGDKDSTPDNVDNIIETDKRFIGSGRTDNTNGPAMCYTPRPVNMAVLYCIKATVAEPYQDVYSAEETRVGTWIDGKPLYRISFEGTTASSINTLQPIGRIQNYDKIISIVSCVNNYQTEWVSFNYTAVRNDGSSNEYRMAITSDGYVTAATTNPDALNRLVIVSVLYTKTTDQPTVSQNLLTSKVELPETLSVDSLTDASASSATVTFPSVAATESASYTPANLNP